MKRAFTLIELLVVIAIIAILAAILFPVFAQAKAAAKRTASLSGVKQMTLGMIQYSASANDQFPPNDSFGGRSVENRLTVNNQTWRPWPVLIYDYIKSTAMYGDPLAPAYVYPSGSDPAFKDLYTEKSTSWGYNSSWLAPVTFDSANNPIVTTKSAAQLAQPASTVLMTSKYAFSEANWTQTGITWWGFGSMTQIGHVDPPDCSSIPQACFDNWGKGSYWDTTRLKGVFEAGAQTGGVSVRANGGSVVTFADGHAVRMTTGALAAGTNWKKDISSADVQVNDESKYLWDDK